MDFIKKFYEENIDRQHPRPPVLVILLKGKIARLASNLLIFSPAKNHTNTIVYMVTSCMV